MSSDKNPQADNHQQGEHGNPIKRQEEVSQNPDAKIDADHPGFPHGQSSEENISPKTQTERDTAAVDVTDGEKKERG
jgi:hypothetical protein